MNYEKIFKNKYLKYKSKYLQLKKQKGGMRDEDFPKFFLDNMITNNCMKGHDLIIDSNQYEKIKNFLNIIKNTYNRMYLPANTDFDKNFIGKTTFDKNDIEKIYSRLISIPTEGAKLDMKKFYYIKGPKEYIEINDFITIKDNSITIGTTIISLSKTKDNILIDLINEESITNINNSTTDARQLSGENTIIGWSMFDGTKTLFNEIAIEAGFVLKTAFLYKRDNIFLLFKEENDLINYCMLNIKEDKNTYLLFPYSYNNFILNSKFETPCINLFEIIKNKLEEIYISNMNPLYSYLNKEYKINENIDSFNLQISAEDIKKLMDKEDGFITRITILVYINKALFEIPDDFSPSKTITDIIENLDDSQSINALLREPDVNKLQEETLAMFNNIYTSTDYKKYITEIEKYYKILPDSFFHLHTTIASNKYILLTIHADKEITSVDDKINYTFIDKNKQEHKITRYKQLRANESIEQINNAIKTHSFYLLFNLNDNEHKLYSFNKLNGMCFKSILFNGPNLERIGVDEALFGDVIGDINHIDSYDVIYTPSIRPCKFFCTNTDKVYTEKQPNLCEKMEGCSANNIIPNYEDPTLLNSTDGKMPYPMKCSTISIKSQPAPHIFIDDILVGRDLMDCDTRNINVMGKKGAAGILQNIINFAKQNSLTNIQLDDESFIQIPDKYFSSINAPFHQSLLYLQVSPKKHSIYSNKFNFKNIHMTKKWYEKLLEEFTRIVTEYTTTNKYSLLNNSNKLLLLPKKPIDINSPDYKKFKEEYEKFDKYIVGKLKEYILNDSTIDEILKDPDIVKNGSINKKNFTNFKSFHDFLIFYNLDRYILYIE